MAVIFKTDKGKVRRHNEDNGGVFKNNNAHFLAVVADGMGGHKAGEVASEIAVTYLQERWAEIDQEPTPEWAEEWLQENVGLVNELIFERSTKNIDLEGMGTTIVAAICTPLFATIVNIGDSRCYLMNDHGYEQLTDDHSLVNELIKTGQISPEDARHHPRKNVLLKAVGTEAHIKMDIKTITFEKGDQLLLCSDGLSNKVTKEEMEDVLKEDSSLMEKADQLIALANDYGGEDNISLAIIEHDVFTESGCDEC